MVKSSVIQLYTFCSYTDVMYGPISEYSTTLTLESRSMITPTFSCGPALPMTFAAQSAHLDALKLSRNLPNLTPSRACSFTSTITEIQVHPKIFTGTSIRFGAVAHKDWVSNLHQGVINTVLRDVFNAVLLHVCQRTYILRGGSTTCSAPVRPTGHAHSTLPQE
jgi:hypothetical protein